MANESPGINLYPRIESLSDLIFGLALSIGALTLINQQVTTMPQLIGLILEYAFSFIILIGVWRAYTILMASFTFETSGLFNANLLLLFLVAVEPFLYNMLYNNNASGMSEGISILYALDLGGMFFILAFFSHRIYKRKEVANGANLRKYGVRRNAFLISLAIVLISCLPVFWSLQLSLSFLGGVVPSDLSIRLRIILWILSPIMMGLYFRVEDMFLKNKRQDTKTD